MRIGFIGIGQMGGRMARRLLEAGYDLVVNDVRKEEARSLLEKGAKWMDTPEGIAGSCPIVLSCLPGPPEVEAVVYGPGGLLGGWKKGDLYVDMSTNSPRVIRRVAETAGAKGVLVLDAPVSGGIAGAEAGTLTIMVGGEAQGLEKIRKIFEAMGKSIFYCGEVGFGNVAKLINNMIMAACNAINAEGFVLGVKAGMDPKRLFDIVRVSSGSNHILESHFPRVLAGNFEPGFRVALTCKDVGLALALGKEYGVPMPVGSAVEQRFLEAKARGLGERGSQSIFLLSEEEAGVKVRSS